MASFVSMSSSTLLYGTPHLSSPRSFPPATQVKNSWDRRLLLLRVKCLSKPSIDGESEAVTSSLSASTSTSTSTDISPYNWCAALGGLGFIETSYLTYLKLTNSDAFLPYWRWHLWRDPQQRLCPCFRWSIRKRISMIMLLHLPGIPLPLIGMVAYGLVATLGATVSWKEIAFWNW